MKFLGVDTSVAVPLPCASVCRLDIILNEHQVENTNSHIVKWTGVLPAKLPTLLTKIEKSLDNEKLGNSVLRAHFATLQEEWAKYEFICHHNPASTKLNLTVLFDCMRNLNLI